VIGRGIEYVYALALGLLLIDTPARLT